MGEVMDREGCMLELREAFAERERHLQERGGGHIGCPPGAACDGYFMLSVDAATWLLAYLEAGS